MEYRYIIGNSPKLPMANEYEPGSCPISFEMLKVSCEMLQEDHVLVIHTDKPLTAAQVSRIEYALLNPTSHGD